MKQVPTFSAHAPSDACAERHRARRPATAATAAAGGTLLCCAADRAPAHRPPQAVREMQSKLSTPHTRRGRAERGTGEVDILDANHGRAERGTGAVDLADAVGTLFGLRQSTSPPPRSVVKVYIRQQSTSPPPRGGDATVSLSRSHSHSPEAEIGLDARAPSGIADAADARTYRVLPGLSQSDSVDKSLVLKRGRFPLYEHPSKREARIRAVIRGDDDDEDDDDFLCSARRPQRKPEVEKEMRSFDQTELDGAEQMEEDRKRAKQLLMEAHAILKGAHEVARTALHAVQQSVDSVSPG